MLNSNPNFERSTFPDRPASGPPAYAPPRAPADPVETPIPVLGKTLLFRGELTAEEDVILQGRVEGSIRHARNLIIGTDGSVLGDVYASHLTVEGLVEGDLHCTEAVIVRATAQVRGNIFAPRVGIMEGATFNGRVEMDPNAAAARGGQSASARQAPRPARAGAGGTSARAAAPPAVTPQTPAPSAAALPSSAVDQMLSTPNPSRK
jgi:cytoskeletal protein CcmA (bactofilin family)